MKKEIRIAIVGVGNCASNLIQGLSYYKNIKSNDKLIAGLMHGVISNYKISDRNWVKKFKQKNLPVIGDDIKSQIGGSLLHRGINHLLTTRGVQVDRAYQLNIGGNTDFLNMLNHSRRKLKEITKTATVQSQLLSPIEEGNLHIGPSDYVPWLKDNKVCYIRIEGRNFGGAPIEIDLNYLLKIHQIRLAA